MRIRRIGTQSVLQYDAFDLDFGEDDTALHILYGPNEAGKSTLLQIIVDLLFGGKIDDAFQNHYDARSRIEGIIEHPGQQPFHIQRRKRYSKLALTDGTQPELAEALLSPYLGGYNKEQFTLLFGFDHDRLRYGGESLLQSGGHAGVSLFEAGGGVQYLQALLKELSDRSNMLLDPSFGARSAKRINKEWRAYKEAEKAIRASGLRGEDWDRQRHEIEAKSKRLQQLQEQKLEKTREVLKLQRIQRVRNLVGERKDVLNQLREIAAVTVLSPELDAYIPDLLTQHESSVKNLAVLEGQYQAKLEMIETIQADPTALAHESDIDTLNEGLQQYQSRMKEEIPRAKVQLDERKREATYLLQSLAPDITLDKVEQLRIPFAEEERIQQLSDKLREARNQLEIVQERYNEAIADKQKIAAELERIGEPNDVSILKGILQQIRAEGDLDEILSKQKSELEQKRQNLQATLQSQTIWNGQLDELKGLAIPLPETIHRFQEAWANAEKGIEDVRRDLEKTQAELLASTVHLEQLELGGRVPVEAELLEARQHRNTGWQIIKQILQQQDPDPEQLATFTSDQSLPDAFEQAIVQADEIADWMRKESDRSAQRAHLLLRKEQLERQIAELEKMQDQKQQQFAKLVQQWRDEWKASRIEPKTPAEMKEWLATFYRPLLEGLHGLATLEREHQNLLQQRDSYISQLQDERIRLQVEWNQSDTGLRGLLQFCDQLVRETDEKVIAYSNAKKNLQDSEAKVLEYENRLNLVKQGLEAVESTWRQMLKRYPSLPADPEVAVRYVAQERQLFQCIREVEQLQSGIDEKCEACARFEREASGLAGRLGEDMLQYPSLEAWVRHARERLGIAKESAVRLQQMQDEVKSLQEQILSLRSKVDEYQLEIERYMQEYNCRDLDGLQLLVQNSVTYKRLEDLRKDKENRLREAGDGLTVEQLEAEVAEVNDPDLLSVRIQDLQSEVKELEATIAEEQQQLWQMQLEFKKLDGSRSDAAEHAQMAEAHLAEVDRLWNEYVRVELARRLLQRAIEQYRQQNESFVLDRASEFFEALTLGKYKGLIVEYDDNDPYIEAIHADGNKRRVYQMSDGTRDQLFLSLRLAFIDQHLTKTNALPLIMDDILVHFDDDRTQATLQILHELAGKTQILYFTHHRSVVDTAQKLMDASRVRIHELASYHKKGNKVSG